MKIAIDWANTGFIILIIIGMVILAALFFGIRYLEYLENKDKKEQKPDPIQKTLLAGIIIFIFYFLGFLVGILDRSEFKKNLWIPFALVGVIGVFYWMVMRAKQPYPLKKQFEICLSKVKEYYEGNEYVGEARIKLLGVYKQTRTLEGRIAGNFLFEASIMEIKTKVWVQVHIYPPEEILHLQPNPPANLLAKLEAEGAAVQDNIIEKEFNGESEDETKTEKT